MNKVNQDGLKKMIVNAFEAHYNEYKYIDKFGYPIDSYVKLITLDDDFSDMLRKYSIFIGYILGFMNADKSYNHEEEVIKLLLESDEIMLLIYVFGGDKDAIASLKNKNIELVNSL